MNRRPEATEPGADGVVLSLMSRLIGRAEQQRARLRAQVPGIHIAGSVYGNYLRLTQENRTRLSHIGESAMAEMGIEGLIESLSPDELIADYFDPLQRTAVEPLSDAPQPALRDPNAPLAYQEHLNSSAEAARPKFTIIQGMLDQPD